MGTLRLIIKQMRQRALGTWLTLLSVLLGVALAIAILLLRDAGQALFGQSEFGYDVIVGVGQGGDTQLVLNSIYHIGKSPGNVPYWVYEQLNTQTREGRGSRAFDFHKHVKLAVPTAVGDVYKGRPIIGTLPKMFISLAPLQKELNALLDEQSKLIPSVQEHPADPSPRLARQQLALVPRVQQLQRQIEQTDREIVPLLDVSDATAKPDFKYGNPVAPRCSEAVVEMRACAEAIAAGKGADAMGRQKNAQKLLSDVLASVNSNSGPLEYRPDTPYELADGRTFHPWKFEAVIGSEVARNAGLKIGSRFRATHGAEIPGVPPETHPEQWQVVGVLKPTHTSADRCLYIPLLTFYSIAEHKKGLEAQAQAQRGQEMKVQEPEVPQYRMVYGDQLLPDLPHTKDFIDLDVPPQEWFVSAILVKSRGGVTGGELIYFLQSGGIPVAQGVNPAQVMQIFFDTFLKGSADVLLLISMLVSIVAGIGILVSIYNSIAARTREIAILRALGATRGKVLTLICAEAGLIGLVGSILGLIVGHGFGGAASAYLSSTVGQGFDWLRIRPDEWIYIAIVVGIALFAGLVPALKAYRTPVATNLVAA